MDATNKNIAVYDLITNLCKHLYKTECSIQENSNGYQNHDTKIIKTLRSKVFEILLNKSITIDDTEDDRRDLEYDPLTEILKYAYVLKVSLKRSHDAVTLENLLDTVISDESVTDDGLQSVLQFLNKLKNFEVEKSSELDIFYYDKPNPLLPNIIQSDGDIPQFQTYPLESFIIPDKFKSLLTNHFSKTKQCKNGSYNDKESYSNHFISLAMVNIQSLRGIEPQSITKSNSLLCITNSFVNEVNSLTCVPKIFALSNTENEYQYQLVNNKLQTLTFDNDTNPIKDFSSKSQSKLSFTNISDITSQSVKYQNLIWEKIDYNKKFYNNHRTWETLGNNEPKKELLFITDLPNSILHLVQAKNYSIDQSEKTTSFENTSEVISYEQFLSDLKLLLLGIESECFEYVNLIGFMKKKNITINSLSVKAVQEICQEVIHWGNCFRYLSNLVTLNPQTNKLERDGPIFLAMCNSIKELLLYYRCVLVRVMACRSESTGLLKFIQKVRPIAILVTAVAKLCRSDERGQCTLGGGSGIISHIYEEVTKVTNPRVALVYYSILKSCCEVYFRSLQKWLFEGIYDDVYGEFMIQAQPEYLRIRGHKFWTKGFVVNKQSVPYFLKGLADCILQCGKTVRLLKICDPKNPMCRLFSTYQPEIKVCLSASMLHEQNLRCEDYLRKGDIALGPIVSLSSTIQDQRRIERERAELVVCARIETLHRIKKLQHDQREKRAQIKRDLLAQLKEQATEAALFREREKEIELAADKLLLQQYKAELNSEKEKLKSYYAQITIEVEEEQKSAEQRIKNMKQRNEKSDELLEEEKGEVEYKNSESEKTQINETNEDNSDLPKVDDKGKQNNDDSAQIGEIANPVVNLPDNVNVNNPELTSAGDENSNVVKNDMKIESSENTEINSSTKTIPVTIDNQMGMNYIYRKNNERSELQNFLQEQAVKNIQSKAVLENSSTTNSIVSATTSETEGILPIKVKININRPTTLNINEMDKLTDAQRNKMKILRQEYGMTPNNNEMFIQYTVGEEKSEILDNRNERQNDNQVQSQSNANEELPKILEIYEEMNVDENIMNINENKNERKESEICSEIKEMKNDEINFNNNVKTLNSTHQNNSETPMSCTTDNFVLSTITPTSQLHSYDEMSPTNTHTDMTASVITQSVNDQLQTKFCHANLLGFSSNVTTPSIVAPSLTIADVETIDNISLQVYLEKSIMIPLRAQSRLVNNAIIKYLLTEHNMLSHLHSFRSYYFLLNGEFAKSLTDSLYSKLYEVSVPIELFNSAALTNILERAITISYNFNSKNSHLLSLSASDIPSQLQISDPDALACLNLNYKIVWPLNIIFDNSVMAQYTKVFKFLIMIGRVSWVLQEDFNIMKIERKARISEQHHKLHLYRHSMTQFINALHNYVTCSVLHASWTEFEKDLENSTTVDQVYHSHITYIKKILSRCMLNVNGEKQRSCLNNMFKVILQFHNRLRSQHWVAGSTGYVHPNFKKLERMYEAFSELRRYLVHVTLKVTTSGYQPHLVHFLDALNINRLYDFSTKTR